MYRNHKNVSWWSLNSYVAVQTGATWFSLVTSGTSTAGRTIVAALTRRSVVISAAIGIGWLRFAIVTGSLIILLNDHKNKMLFSAPVDGWLEWTGTCPEALVVRLRIADGWAAGDTQRTRLSLLEGRTGFAVEVIADGHRLVALGHEILTDLVGGFGIGDQHQLLQVALFHINRDIGGESSTTKTVQVIN